jgi:hypothetical protein
MGKVPSPMWVADGVLTEVEFEELLVSSITTFNYSIGLSDAAVIEGALDTIAEHHPNERIWVERGNDV